MERRTVALNRPGPRAGAHTDGRGRRDGARAPYDREGRARRRVWMARPNLKTSTSDQRERRRAGAVGAF